MINELGKKGQIEIISGGYYEPIFAVIPDEDKLEQINLLNDFIKEHFNMESTGFWLAERVWEPYLSRILELAKIKYILIDDFHVRANGYTEEETFYPYITEEQGSKVIVVPINKQLRYLTPWKKAEDSIDYLSQFPTLKGDRLITLIDDAEKMGVWPAGDRTTYDICFGVGYDGTPWLHKFFTLLENSEWLNVITINEYLNKFKPRGLVYLPSASYDKMSYWVLPTPARRRVEELINKANNNEIPYSKEILEFVKGGFWRGFLIKYHESNAMHKKMLYVRNILKLTEGLYGLNPKGDKISAIKNAWNELYKSQCNDPYWHGQFGGIYFGFMRQSIYHHLIHAEKIAENIMKSYKSSITPNIREYDIDFCGRNEILMSTNLLNIYINCFHGGSIFELDEKTTFNNILCVLQRRKEAYHSDQINIPLDRWRKYAFMDHFTNDTINFENLINDNYRECGNFVDSQYDYRIQEFEDHLIASLWKTGNIEINEQIYNIKITKSFKVYENSPEITVSYTIENLSKNDLEINYLTEIPFYLGSDLSQVKISFNNNEYIIQENRQFETSTILTTNSINKLNFKITTNENSKFFKYDIYTINLTDGSEGNLYQGTSLVLIKPLCIKPDNLISFELKLMIYKK